MSDWNFAVPDWWDRIRAGRSLLPDLPLDESLASRAVKIFDMLRLTDVIGQPRLKTAAGDWSRDVIRAVFGSLDRKTNRRMVPGVLLLVPKKNSKTTNGGGLMLTALLMNERPRARFALMGPTQEIADTAFDAIIGMIDADETLKKLFHVRDHNKEIIHRVSRASLKIMTFSMKVATGGKFAGVLIDEVHLMGKMHFASRVFAQIRGARTAFPEQFVVMITTQSDEPPAGLFKAELQHARAVRDGRAQGEILPLLYEFPEDMQRDGSWREEQNWPFVNPNIGRSVSMDVLRSDHATAVSKGEKDLREWASQHLNVEIGIALHSDRWEGADYWEGAADFEAVASLEDLLQRCEVATIGIDGGGLDDLLGMAVIGRERVTQRWLLWVRGWCHQSALVRRKEIAERLRDFEREGDLIICREIQDDVIGVADIVEQVAAARLLPQKNAIGLDPVGVAAILDELSLRGIGEEQMVGVPQGYRLSGVTKGMARKLVDGSLVHGGRPMMAWCIGNAKTELRGNASYVTKQASGSMKIDPLIAAFNAFDLMSRHPEAAGAVKSVFDQLAERDAMTVADADASATAEFDEAEILADPSHPEWQRARERYEARFLAGEDDY